MMSKRLPLALVLSAALFVTASFAATKKNRRNDRSRHWNDSALMNEDLPRPGNSVNSGNSGWESRGTLGSSGPSLILDSPSSPDHWKGGTGNWSAAGNWNHGVPGMSSDVTIHSGGLDNVTLDISSTINTLKLGGMTGSSSLVGDPTPQNLTVLGALTIGLNGNLCACASGGFGTIAAGSLVNRGSIVFETSGDLQISGNANNSGFLQTGFETGGHVINIAGRLTNSGQFLLDGHGDAATLGSMGNSGSVDVSSASTLTVNGRVNNTGTITTGGFSPGGNTIVITSKLINSGTFKLNGPGDMGSIGNGLNNSGTVDVLNGSTLTVTAGGATTAAMSTIDVEQGSTLNITGDVTNNGRIVTDLNKMGGGNTLNITGNLTNNFAFGLLGSGDMGSISGGVTNAGQFRVGGNGNAMGTIGGDLTNSGNVDVESGSTLNVAGNVSNNGNIDTDLLGLGGGNTLNITGTLTNDGNFELLGAGDGANISGDLNNHVFATIDLENGSTLNVTGNFDNRGTLESFGGSGNAIILGGGTGTLTNEAGGVIDVENGSALTINGNVTNTSTGVDRGIITGFLGTGGNTLNITGALNNTSNGNLQLLGSGDMATIGNGMSNAGTVDVENGSTLTIMGAVTNSGSLVTNVSGLGGGNTLTITGTLTNQGGSLILNGPGDMATIGGDLINLGGVNVDNGSTLQINGNASNGGPFTTGFNGGGGGGNTVTITGNLTNGPHQITLFGDGDTFTVVGTPEGPFAFDNNGGFTQFNKSTATVDGLLFNEAAGFIDLEGSGSVFHAAGGTLNSGAIFVANGSSFDSPSLDNSGTIDLENGSTLTVSGDVSNSGAIATNSLGAGGGNTLNITGMLSNSGTFELLGPGDMATIGTPGMPTGMSNAGFVDVEGGSTLTIIGAVTNSGILATNMSGLGGGNTLTIGPLTNQGGSLILNGPGDMATIFIDLNNEGGVYVDNGSTLQINGDAFNGGTFTTGFNGGGGGGNTVTITGDLTNGHHQITLFGDGDTFTVVGTPEGPFAFDNNGGFTQFNKSTATVDGLLFNEAGGSIDLEGSGSVFHAAGGTLNSGAIFVANRSSFDSPSLDNSGMIDLENGSTLTVSGDVSNSGTIGTNSQGSGGGNTITITGMLTNTATGQINLNGPGDVLQALAGLTNNGLIKVNNGSAIDPPFVNNLGTINIDSLSKFVVGTGSPMGTGYIQLANGTLGEMISATNFGVINVKGSALLDGTLSILLQGGYDPAVGSMYKFLLANPGQINGTFASILNDIFNGGTEKWLVTYDNADGFVELTAEANNVPEPATLLVLIPGLLGMAYGLRRRSVR